MTVKSTTAKFLKKVGKTSTSVGKYLSSNYDNTVRYYSVNYNKVNVEKNTVLFETRDGQNFTDVPKTMLLSMLNDNDFNHYSFFVVFQKEYYDDIVSHTPEDNRIKFIERNSIEYAKALLSAQYLITNSTFQTFFTKKNDQVYINTWHGIPLKNMGFSNLGESPVKQRNLIRNFLMADFLFASNEHMVNMYENDYRLKGLYSGKIIENVNLRADEINYQKIGNDFYYENIVNFNENKKTILYAPTFIGTDIKDPINNLDNYYETLEKLKKEFGDNYNVMFKAHPFFYQKITQDPRFFEYLVDDSSDTSRILQLTDILITNYSSIFFDFLDDENRMIIFYDSDNFDYKNNRGYYIETKDLPGIYTQNFKKIVEAIKDSKNYIKKYSKKTLEFRNKYSSGIKNSSKLNHFIFLNEADEEIKIKNTYSDKKHLLIYSGGMKNNGITSAFLTFLSNIDFGKNDITVLFPNSNSEEFINNFNKSMKFPIHPIFVFGRNNESFTNKIIKRISRVNVFSNKYNILNSMRILANINFDKAVDYDSYSYKNGIIVAFSNAPIKYNILHNDIKEDGNRIVNNQKTNRNMLKYSKIWKKYYDTTFSVSEQLEKINNQKMSKRFKNTDFINNIVNVDNTLELSKEKNNYRPIEIKKRTNIAVSTNGFKPNPSLINFHIDDPKILNKKSHSKKAIFVTNSRLSPEKNLDVFIDAFIEFHNKNINTELWVIGTSSDGWYENLLHEITINKKAESYIKFFGYQKNPFPIVRAADFYVIPSLYEGQSVSLIEALALNKKILASGILQNYDLLKDNKYGLLAKGTDKQSLIDGLNKIYENNYDFEAFDSQSYNNNAKKTLNKIFKD